MIRRGVFDESPTVNRRQPLLWPTENGSAPTPKVKMNNNNNGQLGEWAGGTAAGCAAVCCCCPCAVVNLMFLAVYKVPSGLCRKALRNKRRKRLMKKRAMLLQQMGGAAAYSGKISIDDDVSDVSDGEDDVEGEYLKAAADLEKEMWQHFYGAGFWRSSSQREN